MSKTEEMRREFWRLDDEIRSIEAELKPLEEERNSMAEAEAALRAQCSDIKQRRQAIIERTGLHSLAKDRTGCVAFLRGQTGQHP